MPASRPPDPNLLLDILDELPTAVWVGRVPDGELVYANALFAEILGIEARADVRRGEYVQAYGVLDRAGQPYREDRLPYSRAVAERRTVVVDDAMIKRPDGTPRYVRALGKPLFGPDGEISHVMVAFSDVTEQVLAENQHSLARERLRTAVEHAPIALFTTELDGTISMSEGAALARLGFKPRELVGRNTFELYRDHPVVLDNMRRVLAGETFTAVTEHGETVLETWMAPSRDETGAVRGMIGVATDITERLRLQRQIAHADRMAALGRLAASVAHEINNPLTYTLEAIRLASEIAGKLAGAPAGEQSSRLEQLRKLLEDAGEGAERVRLITRDLKAFTRPDEEVRGPVAVDEAVASAVKLVAKRTTTRATVLIDTCSDAYVHADENRLVQIVVNLLLNAADAFPPGGRDRHVIRVTTRRRDDRVLLEVNDNGPGVPPELRERIFDPFFTTKSVGEGTGLGLYVTRTLVAALGGTIDVDAAEEGGARFLVSLPTTAVRDAAASTVPPPRTDERPRVMIVDDEPMLARVLRLALEEDCEVSTHASGRAALEELLHGPPYDVVFCDLMMADLGGLELYEQLRALAPGRERDLVFMTGGVFDPRVAQLLSGVPNRCVDKPFDIRVEVWRHLAGKGEPR